MSHSTLAVKAYEAIHTQILRGELSDGTIISEVALAKALGVSRTPVREAIRRLSHEGLLEHVPRYGTMVKQIDRGDLRELYQAREALEGSAAGWAAEQITTRQLAQLGVLLEAMRQVLDRTRERGQATLDHDTLHEFLTIDKSFHVLVLEAANNRRVLRMVREAHVVGDAFRMRRGKESLRLPSQAIDHHQQILDALRARDAQGAAQAMAHHIRSACNEAMSHFDELRVERDSDESPVTGLSPELRRRLDEAE